MTSTFSRRDFLETCSHLGIGCALVLCPRGVLGKGKGAFLSQDEEKVPDPKDFTYCGYKCSPECKLFKASQENDVKLKEEVYKEWKWKEKHGVEFDPDTVFCYGCKTQDKPLSPVLQKCTVRECAMEKKMASCIQCKELKGCDKELWINDPKHREKVLEMQGKYFAAKKK